MSERWSSRINPENESMSIYRSDSVAPPIALILQLDSLKWKRTEDSQFLTPPSLPNEISQQQALRRPEEVLRDGRQRRRRRRYSGGGGIFNKKQYNNDGGGGGRAPLPEALTKADCCQLRLGQSRDRITSFTYMAFENGLSKAKSRNL